MLTGLVREAERRVGEGREPPEQTRPSGGTGGDNRVICRQGDTMRSEEGPAEEKLLLSVGQCTEQLTLPEL